MNKFTRTNFILSLILFVIAVVISFLGATDYFTDKAAPSGFAWLALGISSLVAFLGFASLIVEYAKAVAPEWNDDHA